MGQINSSFHSLSPLSLSPPRGHSDCQCSGAESKTFLKADWSKQNTFPHQGTFVLQKAILKGVAKRHSYRNYISTFSLSDSTSAFFFSDFKNNFSPETSLEILLQHCQNSYRQARPLPCLFSWHIAHTVLVKWRKTLNAASTALNWFISPCNIPQRCNVTLKAWRFNDGSFLT